MSMEKMGVNEDSARVERTTAPQGSARHESPERPLKESQVWKTQEGEPLCRVEAAYGEVEEGAYHIHGRARSLTSLLLHGEKNGKPVTIDVLRMTGAVGEAPTIGKILVAEKKQKSYAFSQSQGLVTAPPLDNPGALAVLLHELGHATQNTEPEFRKYLAENRKPLFETEDPASREEVMGQLKASVPDIDEQEISRRMSEWDFFAERVRTENAKKKSLQGSIEEVQHRLNSEYLAIVEKSPKLQNFLQGLKSKDIGVVFQQHEVRLADDRLDIFRLPGVKSPLSESQQNQLFSPEGKQKIIAILEHFQQPSTNDMVSDVFFEGGHLVIKLPLGSNEYSDGIFVELPIGKTADHANAAKIVTDESTLRELEAQSEKVDQAIKEAKYLLQQYIQDHDLADTFNLPRAIAERDANARAMVWMNKMKSAGVNLFAVSGAPDQEEGSCETDPDEPIQGSAHQALRNSINSYRANIGQIRHAKGQVKYPRTS